MASWMVVVVVVSDDPVFLAAFAQQAREGRLLVWATRLIVVSRQAPYSLHPLHQTLALTNSLLLLVDGAAGVARAAGWVVLPYQRPGIAPLQVASWTAEGNLSLHRPLFWDKFNKLSGETNLLVTLETSHRHSVVMHPDPTAPGGVRLEFRGFMVTILDYLAQGINFSYTFKRAPDQSWGAKMQDGSFTGMLGLVNREAIWENVVLQEVHFGLGPFGINAARYEAVDFTWPVSFVDVKVFTGRGSPEVDPWGFLLPLTPWVWIVLLLLVLFLSAGSIFLFTKFSWKDLGSMGNLSTINLHFVGIMLRQCEFPSLTLLAVWVGGGGWWWQRVVLGVWMLMTMVLTRSYEGNLMSLLAVRHLPQPYQTLRDVVDDPSVVMVWHKQGAPIQSVMDATSGIFSEVKASEEQGRLLVLPLIEYGAILDKVINQRIAIIDYVRITRATSSRHFSLTGRCDFYIGQENIMAHPVAMIGQKDSPIIPSLNARITSMTEAGLYNYWNNEGIANYSACERVKTKTTIISSSLSLRQCWVGKFLCVWQ
ncbi:glutamate receptor U1-like [Portunus trituberculatus]|uniref:glutamate receptor U1-like n=1 Tax=Portunus trituberculatus TaxID=210409 RepID=UPI001E1CD1CB|nr:glutamate receptor U1-like [Portunus trituberculatus]